MANVWMTQLAPTLDGAHMPSSGGETYTLQWQQGGGGGFNTLGNGRAAITYSEAIPSFGASQLGIGLVNSDGGADGFQPVMQIIGVGDDSGGSALEQSSILPGAAAGGFQPWNANTDEIFFPADAVARFVYIPLAWHFFKLGLYLNGAPAAGHRITLIVERSLGAGGGGLGN